MAAGAGNYMGKDPLGRKHQLPRQPNQRSIIDAVCNHVLRTEKKSFEKNPSASHVYFDAYTMIHGWSTACEMLRKVRG